MMCTQMLAGFLEVYYKMNSGDDFMLGSVHMELSWLVTEIIWFVSKVSVLIFYLNVYWTHLKLQVISFKV